MKIFEQSEKIILHFAFIILHFAFIKLPNNIQKKE